MIAQQCLASVWILVLTFWFMEVEGRVVAGDPVENFRFLDTTADLMKSIITAMPKPS